MTKNRVVGLIGVLWGGSMLVARVTGGSAGAAANDAFATGQAIGLVFGALLFFVGLYYLVKG
jgi:Na+-driven multidrug efflux pump